MLDHHSAPGRWGCGPLRPNWTAQHRPSIARCARDNAPYDRGYDGDLAHARAREPARRPRRGRLLADVELPAEVDEIGTWEGGSGTAVLGLRVALVASRLATGLDRGAVSTDIGIARCIRNGPLPVALTRLLADLAEFRADRAARTRGCALVPRRHWTADTEDSTKNTYCIERRR